MSKHISVFTIILLADERVPRYYLSLYLFLLYMPNVFTCTVHIVAYQLIYNANFMVVRIMEDPLGYEIIHAVPR